MLCVRIRRLARSTEPAGTVARAWLGGGRSDGDDRALSRILGFERRSYIEPAGEIANRGREKARATTRPLFVTESCTVKRQFMLDPKYERGIILSMHLNYEISPDNLKTLEIKQILLDKEKFGALTFDRAYPPLHELRKMFVEFEELDYRAKLAQDEVNDVDNYTNQLLQYVQRIYAINPATDPTFNMNVRESLENEIISFCQRVSKVLRNNLVFLRQELSLKNQDRQSLAEEQKAATVARKQAEETLHELQKKLDDLNKREHQLENTAGKVGANALGIYFEAETENYSIRAYYWFIAVLAAYAVLIVMVLGTVVYYTFFHPGGWTVVSWQEGLGKVFLFAALWYGLSFITRNFNVNSHLAAVNRHRAAVARTLQDFLASNPNATHEMLQNATEAMFRHVAVGFITKTEKDSAGNNPLIEVINKILPKSD